MRAAPRAWVESCCQTRECACTLHDLRPQAPSSRRVHVACHLCMHTPPPPPATHAGEPNAATCSCPAAAPPALQQLRWTKVVWARKMVTSSAEADARRGWVAFVRALQTYAATTGGTTTGTSEPAPARAGGASVVALTGAGTQPERCAPVSWVPGVAAPASAVAVQVVLVMAVLWLALAVWLGARGIIAELQALSEAVQASRL